jgi:mRNA interferase MazF
LGGLRRGDIVLVALKGDYGKPRPAVVIQSDVLTEEDCDSVVICPMSSARTEVETFRVVVDPSSDNGLRAPSEVMVEKVVGVPRARLRQVVGHLDQASMHALERTLFFVLGLAE